MTKLKRDIDAWSQRIKMSKSRFWVVVEGKSVDAPFYEGVLSQMVPLDDIEIIKIEDIEMEGMAAGGKGSALKAFRYFEANGTLRQVNRSTTVDWLFFVDRDDDDFLESIVESNHLIYTHHADVEAEVMANADLTTAVATSYSIPTAVARTVGLSDPGAVLAKIWKDWISLRLASCACAYGGARFAQESKVNLEGYGEHDPNLSAAIVVAAQGVVGEAVWDKHHSAAESFIAERLRVGALGRSVKGKWVPLYVSFLVQQKLKDRYSLPMVSRAHLLSVSVGKLDFSEEWAKYYRDKIGALLT